MTSYVIELKAFSSQYERGASRIHMDSSLEKIHIRWKSATFSIVMRLTYYKPMSDV